MKKKILLLPFACLCFNACSSEEKLQKPDDWTLSYWLLDSVDISTLDSERLYQGVDIEDSYTYLDENYQITEAFTKSGYTDKECVTYKLYNYKDQWIVTQIYCRDGSYNFCDIYTASSRAKYCKKMGLKREESTGICYSNDNFRLEMLTLGFAFSYIF